MIDYGYGYLILHGTSLFKSERNTPVPHPPSSFNCSLLFQQISFNHYLTSQIAHEILK